VLGWAGYVDGCGHYRIAIPMFGLSQLGHTAATGLGTDLPLVPGMQVVVGQRIVQPERAQLWHALAAVRGRDYAMVFEIDDDLWNLDPANPHAPRYNNAEARALLSAAVSAADAVTTTTEALADVLARHHPSVQVLPNCVDASLMAHDRPRRDRLTIGWAGGESHRGDFTAVANELKSFLRRNPDVDLHFVGGHHGDLLGRPAARHSPGSNNLTEYHHLFDFDIALAPLASNSFNRAKSDVKILEYAALGIPVVASDFGPYAESVQHGVTGFLVRHPHEWAKYLRALVADEAMREEMGTAARAWAATRTIQANAWRWEETYRKVLSS
jgi:glycosyltransferase involved in cell wall biosynthesis